MANQESEGVLEFSFPIGGLDESLAYKDQTIVTTPITVNCRIKGKDGRFTGGQRDGMSKVFDEQAGDDRPVLKMIMITTTYIPPES